MKSYLFAPIVIAGLVTAVGTTSIVNAELKLVKTGQAVASMFDSRSNRDELVDLKTLDAYAYRTDVAAKLSSELKQGQLPSIPSSMAPETSVDIAPVELTPNKVSSECTLTRHTSRERTRTRTVETPRTMPTMPQGTLAGYTFRNLPAIEGPGKNMRVFMKANSPKTFISVNGLGAKDFKFTFDGKKFMQDQKSIVEQQKAFAIQLKGAHIEGWKTLSKEDLAQMSHFGVKVSSDKNGMPEVITIDPAKAAAAAVEHAGAATTDSSDIDNDESDLIATPNR